jgi:Helix-turn-helix domain/RodZ C-terminal domain
MLDIGAQLRETRMRRRIDISEVEAATKIRAKYLRALENEEWSLLPGPTFVKTFLRTYAEYLDLDARSLVEEYRQRYERPSTTELTPFKPGLGGRPPRRRRPVLGPWILIVGVFACLLGALWVLGNLGDDGGDTGSNAQQTATPTPTKTPKPSSKKKEKRKASAPKTVRFQIVATGAVWVCLEDGAGKALVNQRTMQAGEKTKTFRGKHFVVAFGNGSARMRINGRTVTVPSRSDAVGYDLRAGRKPRELPTGRRPTCT